MYLCTEQSEGQEPRAVVQKREIGGASFLKVKNDCRVSLHSNVTPTVFDNFTKML